jgi:hypothetical protein
MIILQNSTNIDLYVKTAYNISCAFTQEASQRNCPEDRRLLGQTGNLPRLHIGFRSEADAQEPRSALQTAREYGSVRDHLGQTGQRGLQEGSAGVQDPSQHRPQESQVNRLPHSAEDEPPADRLRIHRRRRVGLRGDEPSFVTTSGILAGAGALDGYRLKPSCPQLPPQCNLFWLHVRPMGATAMLAPWGKAVEPRSSFTGETEGNAT